MKNIKKIMALIVAMVMIVGAMSTVAFAAPGDLDHNNKLTVSGLGDTDTVKYYQILKWDPDNSEKDDDGNPVGWVWGDDVTIDDAEATTKTVNDLKVVDIIGASDGENNISFEEAGKLAAKLKTGKADGVNTKGTWTVSGVDAGLYMVVVTSNTPGTMYNPIFVAANFIGGNESNIPGSSWIVTSDASYSDEAVAKKSEIPLTKTAKGHDATDNDLNDGDPNSVDVGEEIDFTVTTTIPKFGSNYTDPVFELKDVLEGLKLTGAPVVHEGKENGTALTEGVEGDYVLTDGKKDDEGYTIKFNKTYLDDVAETGQEITITYTAKVTDAAAKIINEEKNTVTLSFSTNPTDTTGHGKLRDRTNHYTFSIDADLLGDSDQESSTEAIKIGLDKDGNPIEKSQTYFHGGTHPALVGAVFGLYTDRDEAANETTNYYTNDKFGGTVTSDGTGRLTINGLDEGTYWLKELTAPNGYIKAQDPIEVKIEAEYKEDVTVKEDADGVMVTYVTNELKSYKVTVGGSETTYSIAHSLSNIETSKVKRDVDSSDKEIVNTKGVELPSTGGMGTTIFYIVGAVLVIGAGILLVTRRRMSAN